MVTLSEYSRLVSAIHAAAITPDHWVNAMDAVRQAVGATTGATLVADGISRVLKGGSLSPDARQAYTDYYRQIDYVLDAVEHGPVGLIRGGEELIALNPHSEFDNDWMRPHHMDDGIFVRLTDGPLPTCFLVASPRRDESFPTAERVELVNALVPHLQQALRTENHLADLQREADDVAGAVDGIRHAVLVVGPNSTVFHLNSAAETMIFGADGLTVRAGRLRAGPVAVNSELHRCVAAALGLVEGGARSGNSILCPRISGRRPYVVHIAPFTSHESGCDAPRALILVIDPESRIDPPPAMLRRLFGLTNAEADIACRVARGQGLAPISDELSLSAATVKTHLQHIFDKTDTHRQAELVRLLISLIP